MDMKSVLYGAHDFNQKHVAIQAGKTKSKHLLGAINILSPQLQLKLKPVDKAIILLELLILNNIDASRALLGAIALQISKQQTERKSVKRQEAFWGEIKDAMLDKGVTSVKKLASKVGSTKIDLWKKTGKVLFGHAWDPQIFYDLSYVQIGEIIKKLPFADEASMGEQTLKEEERAKLMGAKTNYEASMGEQTLKEEERAKLMGAETNYNAWTLLYVSVLSSLKNVLGIVFRMI